MLQLVAAVLHNTGLSERGAMGPGLPQIFAHQLTLSKPGGQIMTTTLLGVLQIFIPSYGPVHLMSDLMLSTTLRS